MLPLETPFLRGKIKVFQYEKGYRFGIDSVILANFIELKPKEKSLEIGAGCGLISFIGALRFPQAKIYLLEKDPLYLRALTMGISANRLERALFPLKGDAHELPFRGNSLDVVFLNPPYFKRESGRQSPNDLKESARRESNFDLKRCLREIASVLKKGGRLYIIFTAFRTTELIDLLIEAKLEPKVLRMVHSYPEAEAKMILIKALKGAKSGVRILPPLFIYQSKGGDYTPELKEWLEL
ncbi:MAG: methyltransferase [Caldimicrobium sp.]|nr:methyltransferase [Caldimicrobium sp.]MCX7612722.1 methyltransferase [Caldimicrobium sp.]MDW8183339.1 methyltransferase [Caldimicrobium sp.]